MDYDGAIQERKSQGQSADMEKWSAQGSKEMGQKSFISPDAVTVNSTPYACGRAENNPERGWNIFLIN